MDPITELVDLDAQRVSGVERPANGTPFLIIKAAACSTCGGSGKINDGNRDCPDCDGPAAKSADLTNVLGDDAELLSGEGSGNAEKAAEIIEALAVVEAKVESSTVATVANTEGVRKATQFAGFMAALEKAHGSMLDKLASMPGVVMRAELADPSALAAARVAVATDGSVVKSPGVPLFSLNTPAYTGVNSMMAQSGLRGPMTGVPSDPNDGDGEAKSEFEGGTSTYPIPAEVGMARKAASLMECIAIIAALRGDEVVKAELASMLSPGDALDGASLSDVATALAHCSAALEALAARTQVEAMAGDGGGDYMDAWDLEDAMTATEFALGVAARLAFSELAEAAKAAGGTTNQTGDGQEEVIDMQMTKEELNQTVAEAVATAMAGVASKDSPGIEHGNLDAGEIHDNGTIGAGLEGVGGGVAPEYVNKSELPELIAAAVKEATAPMAEQVEKMARQPMPGGPILDGAARGAFPASERSGDQSDVVKAQADEAEQRLVEAVTKAEATGTAQELSRAREALSRVRLYKQHLVEYGDFNPLSPQRLAR